MRDENGKKTEPKPDSQEKTCFIIAPFGDDGSEIRRKTVGLIKHIIKPTLNDRGFKAYSSLEIGKPGSITSQVIQELLSADLVIAELTGLNPNVMYELAVRHAAQLPVLTLAENDTDLPFDISQERNIFYSHDFLGATDLQPKLENMIKGATSGETPDNPIYRAVETSIMKQSTGQNDPQRYVIEQLENLTNSINQLSITGATNKEMFDIKETYITFYHDVSSNIIGNFFLKSKYLGIDALKMGSIDGFPTVLIRYKIGNKELDKLFQTYTLYIKKVENSSIK